MVCIKTALGLHPAAFFPEEAGKDYALSTYRNGAKVDPSDVMPNGEKFKNINEFKQLLLKDEDQFARALTKKLMTYSTGSAQDSGP